MAELVIKATHPDLDEPDWSIFMVLCDNVNQKGDTYRQDVIAALDQKLKSKNPQTVSLALSLVDTLEKNCFGPLHRLICTKDFLDNIFQIATKEISPDNAQQAADLVQVLALSFASVGKEYKLYNNLYRSLKNRGVEFMDESKVNRFTPNLSDEVVTDVPEGVHVRYTSPNAKLENDLHIVQQHMIKMHSIITKRNARNSIPDSKQRELDDENDFLSQSLIRLIEVKASFENLEIPQTTRDLCDMLKASIITLLRAYKDESVDVSKVRIYPNSKDEVEDSSDDDDMFF